MAPIGFWDKSSAYFFLIFVSSIFLIISTFRPAMLDGVRTILENAFLPAIQAASLPVQNASSFVRDVSGLSVLQEKNAVLELENAKLKQWYHKAQLLEAQNESLKSLLNIKVNNVQSFVTARVVSDSGNAFVKTKLVNSGVQEGVQKNQAVLSEEGMIGRIIEANDHAARVLLLNDINSRVPVLIEGENYQAVLAGNNSSELELLHLPKGTNLKESSRIVTSGHGGILPYGLPIGRVVESQNGVYKVRLFADLAKAHFVKILSKPDNAGLQSLKSK